ncbi:hypothetical protein F0562_031126 [Nyssa sinensis]|uniref:Methyltransferase type 11 domain-containing protein n=1 Tax=Nyssa sinensis TaxID=561372 RepID=A0A5J5AS81_9ASTE|nr:hypothetical protein F0562_031126 [Nyssa sinensis]
MMASASMNVTATRSSRAFSWATPISALLLRLPWGRKIPAVVAIGGDDPIKRRGTEDPVKRPKSVVDFGCGIGGSSRYLARKYGAQCQGITLSPVQAQRAQALAAWCC